MQKSTECSAMDFNFDGIINFADLLELTPFSFTASCAFGALAPEKFI